MPDTWHAFCVLSVYILKTNVFIPNSDFLREYRGIWGAVGFVGLGILHHFLCRNEYDKVDVIWYRELCSEIVHRDNTIELWSSIILICNAFKSSGCFSVQGNILEES